MTSILWFYPKEDWVSSQSHWPCKQTGPVICDNVTKTEKKKRIKKATLNTKYNSVWLQHKHANKE